VSQTQLAKFLPQIEAEGVKIVYLDPKKLGKIKTKLQTVFPSSASNKVRKLEENFRYYQILILTTSLQLLRKS
jgi:3-dehydroquinate synthase II